MKPKSPLITVIIPVFNAGRYVREAIESIASQTYTNLEILIIDDGSTDDSLLIIQGIHDPRVKVVRNRHNIGLRRTLNKALALSQGKYIARMDADDISYPHRLATQVTFMEENPEISICGSWFRIIPGGSIIRHPLSHDEIVSQLFRDTAFGHPTIMFRSSFVKKANIEYPESQAEDYALWVSLIGKAVFANIPEVLLDYRWHGNNLSQSPGMTSAAQQISLSMLKMAIPEASEEQSAAYLKLMRNEGNAKPAKILDLALNLMSHHEKYGLNEKPFRIFVLSRLSETLIVVSRRRNPMRCLKSWARRIMDCIKASG